MMPAQPENRMIDRVLFAASAFCLIMLMFAASVQPFLLFVDRLNWADRQQVLFVLWFLGLGHSAAVGLAGYLFRSNRLAAIIAASAFVFFCSANRDPTIAVILSSCLGIGVLLSFVLNWATYDTRHTWQGFVSRVAVIVVAVQMIALIAYHLADPGQKLMTFILAFVVSLAHTSRVIVQLKRDYQHHASIANQSQPSF